MICENCKNKNICKYTDLINKLNKDLNNLPIPLEVNCKIGIKEDKHEVVSKKIEKKDIKPKYTTPQCPHCGSRNTSINLGCHTEISGFFKHEEVSGGYFCKNCGYDFGQTRTSI